MAFLSLIFKKIGEILVPIFLREFTTWFKAMSKEKIANFKDKRKNQDAVDQLKNAKTPEEVDDAVEEIARRSNKS